MAANHPHVPSPRTAREDARENLSTALVRLYTDFHNEAALVALVRLGSDGHYQETLNTERFGLLLRYPEGFARVLHRDPDLWPWMPSYRPDRSGFTFHLIRDLQSVSPEQKAAVVRLRERFAASKDPTKAFMFRYLSEVMQRAARGTRVPTR